MFVYTPTFYRTRTKIETDEDQKKALAALGNTIVFAGPGSGKTTVLTVKAAASVSSIPAFKSNACITFSTEAANVMKCRIKNFLIDSSQVLVSTIHAFCLQYIISPFCHVFLKASDFPINFRLASDKQIAKIFEESKAKLGVNLKISQVEMNTERRNRVRGLSHIIPETYDVALRVAKIYEDALHKQGLIDFEDIINYSLTLLINKEVIKFLEAKYEWLFIDEYQDLGRPLHEIVLKIFTSTKIKLFVVGDTNQSIYGFTGANPKYMDELKTFKIGAKGFEIIDLKNNYRSSKTIVSMSGEILGDRNRYKSKNDFPESKIEFIKCENDYDDQLNYVMKNIIPACDNKGIRREEIGIILPRNDLVKKGKIFFEKAKIPVYVSKRGFERKKFILWLESLADWCSGNEKVSIANLFDEWCNDFSFQQNKLNLAAFQQIIVEAKKVLYLIEWIAFILNGLEFNLNEEERDNFDKFQTEIQEDEYTDFCVTDFSKIGKPIGQVVLLNWHLAKGLEFDVIVLTGISEDEMPRVWERDENKKKEKLEEEKRKFFVGLTRARIICYLMHSEKYMNYKNEIELREPSQFWIQIMSALENDIF